jgi:hypothetical protein
MLALSVEKFTETKLFAVAWKVTPELMYSIKLKL